jgi:hypothetical protein
MKLKDLFCVHTRDRQMFLSWVVCNVSRDNCQEKFILWELKENRYSPLLLVLPSDLQVIQGIKRGLGRFYGIVLILMRLAENERSKV